MFGNRYDQYLDAKTEGNNRDSGAAFGVGMGLLGEVSDDSDDDDDDAPPSRALVVPKGKNQALFEALNGPSAPSAKSPADLPPSRQQPANGAQPRPAPPPAQRKGSDPFRDVPAAQRREDARRPTELMIPPVAASMNAQLAGSPQFPPSPQQVQQQQLAAPPYINRAPSPAAPRDIPSRLAAGSPMPAPRPQRPAPAFMIAPPGSPVPSSPAPAYSGPSSPMLPVTPLQLPPSTPITPLFAAPPTKPDDEKAGLKVTFTTIMRSEDENVLLERTREKGGGSDDSHSSDGSRAGLRRPRRDGDDFWRRFSVVAHQSETDARKRNHVSSWLSKTEGRARSYSRWVAISGIFILALIAGGVAAGIYFNHGQGNGHAAPVAIGGKEEQSDITSSTTSSARAAGATTRTGLNVHTLTTENGSVMAIPTPARRGDGFVGATHTPGPTPSPTPHLADLAGKLEAARAPAPGPHHHQLERNRRHHRNRIID